MNATLLHRCYNRTGEAATWMPGLECLLWVDIDNGILYQYTPDEGTVKEHTLFRGRGTGMKCFWQ